ncbi:MAG: ketopantoate reductase C-terminal domain-containing protein, partial [Thermoanaerobaculia bacterium]|nr:ketopantoate reductase C-terminal domain-containing protein [Thermoanaerobaculia bacterium]
IRDDLWLKLWGNLAFNPLSVLSGASLGEMGADPDLCARARRLMAEGERVARASGARLSVDLERRLQWAIQVGDHRTSMLQDFEAGRALETGSIVAAVSELGRRAGVATPELDAILAEVEAKVAERDRRAGRA